MLIDLNIYFVLIINSILSGIAGGFGGWLYHNHLAKHIDKLTKKQEVTK